MEKDIDKIAKNNDTDIVIRIDDFGGRLGLTIREFVKGERYTGFTKAGTRIPAEKFKQFKAAINSINEKDLEGVASSSSAQVSVQGASSGKKEEIRDKKDVKEPKGKKPVKKEEDNLDEFAM